MSDTPVTPVTQEAPTNEAPADNIPDSAPAQPEVRKHKVKVEGNEVEVDESELIRGYSRSQASMKRFEEASKLKQEAEGISSKFKSDPVQALIDAGHSPAELAQAIILKQIEKEFAEPEDPRDLELKKYKDKEQQEKDELEAKEFNEKAQAYADDVSARIVEAMESTGLSKDPYTVRAAALFIRSCVMQGFEPDATEIRDAIEGRVRNDYKSQVSSKEGQELVEWLGEEVVNKIRKFDLSRLRPNRQQQPLPQAKPQEAPAPRKETKWEIAERMKKWAES